MLQRLADVKCFTRIAPWIAGGAASTAKAVNLTRAARHPARQRRRSCTLVPGAGLDSACDEISHQWRLFTASFMG